MLYNFSIMLTSKILMLIAFFIILMLRIRQYNKRLDYFYSFYNAIIPFSISLLNQKDSVHDEKEIVAVQAGIKLCFEMSKELRENFEHCSYLWWYESWSPTGRRDYSKIVDINEYLKNLLKKTAEH